MTMNKVDSDHYETLLAAAAYTGRSAAKLSIAKAISNVGALVGGIATLHDNSTGPLRVSDPVIKIGDETVSAQTLANDLATRLGLTVNGSPRGLTVLSCLSRRLRFFDKSDATDGGHGVLDAFGCAGDNPHADPRRKLDKLSSSRFDMLSTLDI